MQAYLKHGEAAGVHERFLTKTRKNWYEPEKRASASIWVTVFYRGAPRFVLNEAGILHLTTFHGIYLKPLFSSFELPLLAYLSSEVCADFIRENRREYGDGLLKLEPRDVERILVPDFTTIPESNLQEIRNTVSELCQGALPSEESAAWIYELFSALPSFAQNG
jgi:adenine-specific DNA-methyltransferase